MDPATAQPPGARFRVVVSIDFSDASRHALEVAEAVVRPAGSTAELHLVHVTSPLYWPGVVPSLGPGDADLFELMRTRLQETASSAQGTVEARVVAHVRLGEAAHEVASVAREIGADLIVIGAHRRGALSSALHRSMTSSLVRQAPCSVLTALPKDELAEAAIEPPCKDCVAAREASGGKDLWCERHAGHHVHGHLHYGARDQGAHESWAFHT